MTARNSEGGQPPAFETVSKRPARDRIFETAKEMFYEHGIRAVGVEAIAAEADATKMTLYRNFPSKDELVAEVLRDQVRDYAAWWNEALSGCSECPREKLEAVFDSFANKACVTNTYGCPLANAAVELHEPDNPARIVSVDHKREVHRRLAELCTAAGAKDDELADGLMMLMEGAYTARLTLGADGPGRSVARAARALIREYLD